MECGTSHQCTNIHNFYNVKLYTHFEKSIIDLITHKKIHLQSNRTVS